MTKNRVLAAGAAIAIIVAAIAWYFASPAHAMNQLKNAAQSGDSVQLEQAIDFPKVRDSLKSQIRAMLAREMAKPGADDDPFGKFGAILAMGMVDSMVEGFVTPESIAAMVEEGRMTKSGQANGQAADAKPADWDVERDGFDRFTATPRTVDGKPGPSLIFERDGLGWKLSGLNLPPQTTAEP